MHGGERFFGLMRRVKLYYAVYLQMVRAFRYVVPSPVLCCITTAYGDTACCMILHFPTNM